MSLILEALKKLERDKQVEGRGGFLVMAARPWPSPGEDRRPLVWVAVGAIIMMAVGAGLALWLWRGSTRPTTAQAPAPAPPPVAAPVAPVSAAAPTAMTTAAPAAPVTTVKPQPPVERIVSSADTPPSAAALQVPATAAAVAAPTAPAASPSGPAPRFRLTAISERDGKPVAMLNERLVFEGDSFDDVTVVKIGDSDVELKVAGKTVVVPF